MEILLLVLVLLVILAVVGRRGAAAPQVGRRRRDARAPEAPMSVLMRAREITGRPVVSLAGAEALAEVKDVVFSFGSATVVGFTLNRRGFLGSPLSEVLPWSRVSALGPDALMVDGGGCAGGGRSRDRRGGGRR